MKWRTVRRSSNASGRSSLTALRRGFDRFIDRLGSAITLRTVNDRSLERLRSSRRGGSVRNEKAFKVGDEVEVVYNDNGSDDYVGDTGKIADVRKHDKYPYRIANQSTWFSAEELKLVRSKSMGKSTGKYYRVVQDTFIWKKGAILEFNASLGNEGGYEAINDLWDACDLNGEWITSNIIESPENVAYFERVYNVGKQDKMVFATKAKAQELANSMFAVEGGKK